MLSRHETRNVGVYLVKVWNCATNLDEPVGKLIFESSRRSLVADRRRNPDLPAFDASSCEVEDVFDWTLRAAAREIAHESAATDR